MEYFSRSWEEAKVRLELTTRAQEMADVMEESQRRKKKEKGRVSHENMGEKKKKEEKVTDEDKATARIDSNTRARDIVDVIEEES